MPSRRPTTIIRLLPLVAALALAACGGGSGSTSTSASAGQGAVKSSITVGVSNPNYATQMPIFIAKAKGYFKAVGIDSVRVITTDNFVQGLVGGSLDLSQGDTPQFLNAAAKSGRPIKLVANYRYKEWQMLGVGKGISKASDLIGKNVTAGERASRNEYVLTTILRKLGVDPGKVNFVPLGGASDARLQALLNGQVAGASIFPRHVKPLEQAGGKVLYQKLALIPQEFIATMGSFLDGNRATVEAYLQATLRARRFMDNQANKAQVLSIMRAAKFEVPPAFAAVYKLETEQISPDGGFSPAGMDVLVKQESDLGFLPKGLDWRKYVDLSSLYQAQRALGMKQNPPPSAIQGR